MGKVISVTTRTEQPHWVGSFVNKIANLVPRLSLLPTLSRLRGRGDPGNEYHITGRICIVFMNFTTLIVLQKLNIFDLFLNHYSNDNNSSTALFKICQNRAIL